MADPRTTADDQWVSVGAYPDVESAQAVSGRLLVEGVQNRLVAREPGGPLFGVLGEWSILVPPEAVEAAERILAEPPPTDAELTALALEDPPPDDFDPSANPPEEPQPSDEPRRWVHALAGDRHSSFSNSRRSVLLRSCSAPSAAHGRTPGSS